MLLRFCFLLQLFEMCPSTLCQMCHHPNQDGSAAAAAVQNISGQFGIFQHSHAQNVANGTSWFFTGLDDSHSLDYDLSQAAVVDINRVASQQCCLKF